MRILLFTGKGGVGKTTSAAAEAVRAAAAGQRTTVLSTDAAHSLADALGVRLTDGVREEVAPGLHALQVSAAGAVDPSWRIVQDYLLGVLDRAGLDPVLAEELTSLPGADELAALMTIRRLLDEDDIDLLVVDCAPTAETLRLLALPEVLAWHLERLLPAQRVILGALHPKALAAAGIAAPGPDVIDAVRGWHADMRRVHATLTSAATSVRLVLTPETVVVAEARRTLTSLGLYGYAVDAAIVNRIVPDADRHGSPDPWLARWNEAQRDGLEQARESLPGIPLITVPFTAGEPVGVAALADLAAQTDRRELEENGEATRSAAVDVSASDEGFVLRFAVPHATSADVSLSRREDDLLLDVAGAHRVVTMPSVLRRCVITSAVVRDGVLNVNFVPDQEVWPRVR